MKIIITIIYNNVQTLYIFSLIFLQRLKVIVLQCRELLYPRVMSCSSPLSASVRVPLPKAFFQLSIRRNALAYSGQPFLGKVPEASSAPVSHNFYS